MASNAIMYDDGFQAGATAQADRFKVPVQDGPKRVSYPFKNGPVPDPNCIVTERDFVVRKAYDVELINATTLNGGFETAGGGGADVFGSWVETYSNGTLSLDTVSPHSGASCLKWIATSGLRTASLKQSVLTPGRTYRVSLWAKSDTGAAFTGVSVYGGVNLVLSNNAVASSWTKYEAVFTAGSSVFELLPGAGTSNAVYIDDVTLTEIASVEAFEESAIMGVNKSFTNKFLYSSDFTNAAWVKANTGTGVLPVTTAGFTGPDGALPAWRVQMDCGAGAGYSRILQIVTGLANPHASAVSFWYKSNTSSSSTFVVSYYDAGSTISKVLSAGQKWKQFWVTNSVSGVDSGFSIRTELAEGSGQTADILISAPQLDVSEYIGPFISTTSAEVTRSLAYVDGVSTPKIYDNFTFMDYDQDSLAFIVNESDPVPVGVGNLLRFTRRFARIPANQVVPSSKWVNRPVLHGIKSGTAYAVAFDDQSFSHVFTSRKTISSIGAITLGTTPVDAAAEVLGTLPHDTFYMEDSAGSNLTQYCDTSIATISAALITTFSTGITNWTIAGTPGGFTIKWTNGARNIKIVSTSSTAVELTDNVQSGSFSIRALKPAVTADDTQKPNQNPSVRTINATGHGGAVGDRVAFWNGDALVATSVVYSVPTADSFTVPLKDVDGKDLTLTTCGFSSDAAQCVVNGNKMCSTRLTQRFYLPGYSTGITTAADITPPATATDPISWLAAVVATTAWVVDSVSDLASWQGPILMQETTEIQMSDAIDTVTP